jgi:hypothetical protein
MSAQHHTPAALLPEPTEQKAGWDQSRSGRFAEAEEPLHYQGSIPGTSIL